MDRHHVANFETYAGAQRAVDALSDADFPVAGLSIIGDGVQVVETVTGRRTRLDAALAGLGSGAVTGGLLGWLFGLFSWVDPIVTGLMLAVYGALIGALIGAVIGFLAHAALGGRRDFSSVRTMEARTYEVVAADGETATRARHELTRLRVEVAAVTG